MKKKIVIGLVFASGFLSCEKCQDCTTVIEQNAGGIIQSTSTTSSYCGDEYNNAPTPTSYSQNVAGITQQVDITCQDQ